MSKKFYITTTLPYINADPHIGFALEIIRADALARFKRAQGDDVFFNTGTDEHGLKIYQKAQELGMDVQKYCDEHVEGWYKLKNALNLSYDNFIRTTDEHHIKAAQEFWRRAMANGYIYKKQYKIKYCVGCELEKTDSELVDGKCPLHPNRELEVIEEENYFFKFSEFQNKLLELYKNNHDFVVPATRLNEIKKFVEMGLEDFSISRLKSKMPWGVPIPNDDEQVMYVWFDALVNYISAIGWPDDEEKFNSWWPGVQVAGKDNLRQQSAMWQAMLMAVGSPNSEKIYINSFITSNGQKMSKSLGNVISPYEMIDKYGTDGTRYLLLSLNTFSDDMDITWQGMDDKFNADLANGLGNLVARVSNLLEKNEISINVDAKNEELKNKVVEQIELFRSDEAIKFIWEVLRKCDEVLTIKQPWKMADTDKIKNVLEPIAQNILVCADLLLPIMPETAAKIKDVFTAKEIKKGESLFPRI
ncbi:MAG: Methionine--tRNA ligase [Parcubacteria group bacterium ADurb.Bin316]|nr:MAG: Methionine--tRNA ligase [Parcubacteria group bacterium ADurb.Bin316]HOZ55836.1 methionine--tRNA ligase [bacterium]